MNWYDIAVIFSEAVIIVSLTILSFLYWMVNRKKPNFMIHTTTILVMSMALYHGIVLINKLQTDITGTHSGILKSLLLVSRMILMMGILYFLKNTVKQVD